MRTVLFSTLYPSAARPTHGVFVETRLRHLLRTQRVETKVVAPVPWVPPTREKKRLDWAQMAATAQRERLSGIDVLHPRYALPPKIGENIAPFTLAACAWPAFRALRREGFDFDLIDAHYYYPDGVAAALLARALKKPVVITARGTDLNLISEHAFPRRLILHAADQAKASVGVCQALMTRLAEMGADPKKLHVLRNGVDLDLFSPERPEVARTRLGLDTHDRLIVSVGLLIERKGHHVAVEALPLLPPDVRLAIVGEGPEHDRLAGLATRLGVQNRVFFAGSRPQAELRLWYSAADALVLCSSREGWANVLLESMACGTPVVATSIWGTPEVVQNATVGRLIQQRDPRDLSEALLDLWNTPTDRAQVRAYAEGFSWDATTRGQLDLFTQICR
ncbi:MAG: glycosyltransferase [Deltaproteobacteria bacterium]|nr:glycosyltransferase [Deltaproteobacteria bacterium]